MRKRHLLIALALSLGAAGARAQWPDPVPQGITEITLSESQDNGTPYYLYDTLHKGFYCSGNGGGTQGSWGEPNSPVYFIRYADPTGFTALILRIYVPVRGRWDDVFLSSTSGVLWNDCGGRDKPGNLWAAEWAGDKVRFYATGPDSEQYIYREENMGFKVYIGYVEDGSTIYWPTNPGVSKVPSSYKDDIRPAEFTLVTQPAYDAYLADKARAAAANELLALVERAKATYDGIDLSAVRAVLDNCASTMEQIDAARSLLTRAMAPYATADNPVDVTVSIRNPAPGATGSAEGWEGTRPGVYDGSAELYDKSGFDLWQDIEGLPDGIYRANVHALYRVGSAEDNYDSYGRVINGELQNGYVYARSGGLVSRALITPYETCLSGERLHEADRYFSAIDKYAPNRVAGFTAYDSAGYYNDNAVYAYVTGGKLRLGLENGQAMSGTWCVFNNWSMEYLGTSAEAVTRWREEAMARFDARNEDAVARAELTDAYAALSAGAAGAATAEAVIDLLSRADSLTLLIKGSAAAYAAYDQAVWSAMDYIEEHDMGVSEQLDSLDAYLNGSHEAGDMFAHGSYATVMKDLALDNAQLQAEAAFVAALLERAVRNAVAEGSDLTRLMQNASLDDGPGAGWTVSGNIWASGRAPYQVVEAFNSVFDIHQDMEGVPNGIYRLDAQAFHRNDPEGDERPVVIYLNDRATPVMDINDDPVSPDEAVNHENCYIDTPGAWPSDNVLEDGSYVPNSTDGASYAFGGGRYRQAVLGLVQDGRLRVGMRDTRQGGNGWTCFRNFRLTYMAKNPEAIDELLRGLRARLEDYRGTARFCKAVGDSLEARVDQGLAEEDRDAKFDALKGAYALLGSLERSVAVYNELNSALEWAYSAYLTAAQNAADPESEAHHAYVDFEDNTYVPLQERIYGGDLSDEEARELALSLKSDPKVDIVYAVGDLLDAPEWNSNSGLYPLRRQADGSYRGTIRMWDRSTRDGYGNRSVVWFEYFGKRVDAGASHPRFITEGRNSFSLSMDGAGRDFLTYGGEWRVTLRLDSLTAVFEPAGAVLWPATCYAVGDIEGDVWQLNSRHPLAHQGNGLYTGTVEMRDVEKPRLAIYAGEWSVANGNWGESRLGTCDKDEVVGTDRMGQALPGVDWGYDDAAWQLPAAGRYDVRLDLRTMTVTFSDPNSPDGIGQTAAPGDKGDALRQGRVYNLSGARVRRVTRGLYIVDGRKVLVR